VGQKLEGVYKKTSKLGFLIKFEFMMTNEKKKREERKNVEKCGATQILLSSVFRFPPHLPSFVIS
jgi:hypothetical protein